MYLYVDVGVMNVCACMPKCACMNVGCAIVFVFVCYVCVYVCMCVLCVCVGVWVFPLGQSSDQPRLLHWLNALLPLPAKKNQKVSSSHSIKRRKTRSDQAEHEHGVSVHRNHTLEREEVHEQKQGRVCIRNEGSVAENDESVCYEMDECTTTHGQHITFCIFVFQTYFRR